MRKTLIILPLLLCASPAVAQEAPPPMLPPELADPATAQRIAGTVQALSDALLDVRVGGIRAALEGREATPRERNVTVGDLARRDDPDFDRRLHHQLATVGPKIEQGVTAVNRVLPEVIGDVDDAQRALERAVTNLPDPTYPRR
jgi:hypothetical protein